jgi:hypothetical protein
MVSASVAAAADLPISKQAIFQALTMQVDVDSITIR